MKKHRIYVTINSCSSRMDERLILYDLRSAGSVRWSRENQTDHASEETAVTFQLRSWPRPLYDQTGESPFLLYCVYGEFAELPTLSGAQYNSAGVPAGVKLELYNRAQHKDIIETFLTGEI